ncbi:MAG TPA: hypothetical protein VIL55_13100, partial [Naasia sp.]
MIHWGTGAAAAALLTLLALGAATPAAAAPLAGNPSTCAGTYFAEGGRELFDVDEDYVPPPLRTFPWSCSSKVAGREWGDGERWAVYDLVWTDVEYRTVVDVLRSFEGQGWIQRDGAVGAVNDTDGLSLTAAELAAIRPDPYSVRARFGDDSTGEHIVELTYWDGDEVVLHESITSPTLLISLSVRPEGFAGGTGLADPSVLSALRSIGDVRLTAAGGAVLGTSAVVLMLIVGYPSALLDSVLSPRLDALRARLLARRKRRSAPGEPSTAPPIGRAPAKSRPVLFAAGIALTAAIVGFVDPAYGLNPLSLRLFLTALVSLLLFNLATLAAVRALLRRIDPALKPAVTFRWGSLAFVAVAVGLARLLDFQPGVILGLVAGLTFAAALSATREAVVVLLGTGLALVLGLLAWAGYSLIAPLAAAEPGNGIARFATELLSAVTIEGISTMPLALLPLLALDGAAVFAWRKWVWAGAYAGGLAAFLLVMVTVPDSWTSIDGDYAR